MTATTTPSGAHYDQPSAFEQKFFARSLNGLMRLGLSVKGSRVLEHTGRTSGRTFRTPVNLLAHDGNDYLVAPRGETQWVRNVRASGRLTLCLGRRRTDYTATEVPVEERVPMLRAYLSAWAWEVGKFFQGVGADASDEDLAGIAPMHPIFRLERA
jgi:deazaflavin-dependent oxidoreductase (nitroreductase family)